jgi:hypothetical protein
MKVQVIFLMINMTFWDVFPQVGWMGQASITSGVAEFDCGRYLEMKK